MFLNMRSRKKFFLEDQTDEAVFPMEKTYNKKNKFQDLFGFQLEDISSWLKFIKVLHRPTDPSSLGITRILFGLLMLIDIPQERGLANLNEKWGDPEICHFPLFNFLKPLPLQWMYIVFLVMILGASGIVLGFFYRVSCLMFLLSYWYIFLLDKTSWNNHSYLYGLLSILLFFSDGNRYWSIDGLLNPKIRNAHIPLWNVALVRAQLFIVYFFAGVKKIDQDWLGGYPMVSLSEHWMFDPFRILLSNDQIDFFVVHLSGFLLDLTVGFFLFFDATRLVAMIFCSAFNLMNSQIFVIGMFPYMMLAVMPIFCYPNWPKKMIKKLPLHLQRVLPFISEPQKSNHCLYPEKGKKGKKHKNFSNEVKYRQKIIAIGFVFYLSLQAFLPFSHFITKGYNNWTNGLYGYSWDMMVHSWHTQHIKITCFNKATQEFHYLDPMAWSYSQRWSNHADMVKQLAVCISKRLVKYNLTDVALYFDVWRSLNLAFQQRLFDPRVDILKADWSVFHKTSWVMPLLSNLLNWRWNLESIRRKIYDASNFTTVIFVADFPGLYLENFVEEDFGNTSIEVLNGTVLLEFSKSNKSITLNQGMKYQLPAGEEHVVYTLSDIPSCYMYHYINTTFQTLIEKLEEYENSKTKGEILNYQDNVQIFETLIKENEKKKNKTSLHYYKEFWMKKLKMFQKSASMLGKALFSVIMNTPLNT